MFADLYNGKNFFRTYIFFLLRLHGPLAEPIKAILVSPDHVTVNNLQNAYF